MNPTIKFKAYNWLFVVECYNFCNFFLNFIRPLNCVPFHSILLANNFRYHLMTLSRSIGYLKTLRIFLSSKFS
ncbi:hypothetical protein RJT34_25829 [Clitoria ternatea]|uniref:Uncharacterized protein n=1 Tax=Clitoria ternatea TaxID=43366 RepID=A0AAN9IIV4_CLITE